MRRAAAAGLAASVLPLFLTAAQSDPVVANPVTVVPVTHSVRTLSYPVHNAAGALLRNASYRVTDAGGNCCEVVVAAMASGRLLELGGGYPFFSDDRGVTWRRVSPLLGLNGEGSVVAAPGGDIVGIAWSLAAEDRVIAYKYTAATGTWAAAEGAFHTPFYDRPWVTVAKGPFTWAGGTAPYLTILHGGYPLRIVEAISFDGLNYFMPSVANADVATGGSTSGPLAVATDADLDYLQPPYRAKTSPLPKFGAIRADLCTNGTAVLTTNARWQCRNLPGGRVGQAHVDSRGWLHEVTPSGTSLVYRMSTDGGTTWRTTTTPLPGTGTRSFSGTTIDFKSHGALAKTAVVARARIGGSGQQDLVFVYSYAGGTPALTEVHHIGRGDLTVGSSLGAGLRLDFSSIAILPDGKLAVSFYDSTTGEPALAIEL